MLRRLCTIPAVFVVACLPNNMAMSAAPDVQFLVGLASDPQTVPLTFFGGIIDGAFVSFGSTGVDDVYSVSWQLFNGPDPFIPADGTAFLGGAISIVNQRTEAQTFLVMLTMAVTTDPPPGSSIGFAAELALRDQDLDGFAEVTDAGQPMLIGQLNGINTASAFPSPFQLIVNELDGTASDVGGVEIVGTATSIGIVHKFTLSAGDSFRIGTGFGVSRVPEFGSLSLGMAGIAISGVWLLRRRTVV